MHPHSKTFAKSWLAFDLNILRRLRFSAIAIPFLDRPAMGTYLKRWGMRVMGNDPMQSAWARGFSQIVNKGEKLSPDDVNIVLEDAYVPGYRIQNQALANWFSETDSWWFDNVRRNIDRLPSQMSRAIASSIAIGVGDYVLSFKDDTSEMRQPLPTV